MINQMIPPLKVDDDAHKALVWMDEFYCPHLPVVRDREFLGFISESIILESNNIDKKVSDFPLSEANVMWACKAIYTMC